MWEKMINHPAFWRRSDFRPIASSRKAVTIASIGSVFNEELVEDESVELLPASLRQAWHQQLCENRLWRASLDDTKQSMEAAERVHAWTPKEASDAPEDTPLVTGGASTSVGAQADVIDHAVA